jgi:hypothetical protein
MPLACVGVWRVRKAAEDPAVARGADGLRVDLHLDDGRVVRMRVPGVVPGCLLGTGRVAAGGRVLGRAVLSSPPQAGCVQLQAQWCVPCPSRLRTTMIA